MATYRLPFENDGQWKVGGGNWDDPVHGHYNPTPPTDEQAYAWDMLHPTGGNVLAARAGVVINLDGETPDGDTSGDGPGGGSGNFVWVKHADQSLAAYLHLKHHSLKVSKGQWVAQGQLLALSGFTGHASEPHLHVDVHSHVTSAAQPDLGVQMMTHFEDVVHTSWRPRAGQVPQSNNAQSRLRQDFWKHCVKCQGLYFAGNASSSCPAGAAHFDGGSGNYTLSVNSPSAPGQHQWNHCVKCEGLYFWQSRFAVPGRPRPTPQGEWVGRLRARRRFAARPGAARLALVQQVPGAVLQRAAGLSLSRGRQALGVGKRELRAARHRRGHAAELALVLQVPGPLYSCQRRVQVPGGRRPRADGRIGCERELHPRRRFRRRARPAGMALVLEMPGPLDGAERGLALSRRRQAREERQRRLRADRDLALPGRERLAGADWLALVRELPGHLDGRELGVEVPRDGSSGDGSARRAG